MLRFLSSARSHQGMVRSHNEDAGFAGSTLLVIADGVGGEAAGEVASSSTAYVLAWYAMRPQLVHDPAAALREAVATAHQHLRDGVRQDPARAGMATTLTAILGDGERFALAHAGDSRCYLLRDGVLKRITRDDTFVQDLVDAGDLAPEDVKRHPYGSVVVRSLNAEVPCDSEVVRLDLQPGDRLLLCSDGLTDVVDDDIIAAMLPVGSPTGAAWNLVEMSLDAGAPDNVTCVVGDVETVSAQWLSPVGSLVGALWNPHKNLIDPGATFAPTS